MSKIRAFRINAFDSVAKDIEFYCKVEDEGGYVICNLGVDNDGLFYYRAKSRILTANENKKTRETFDSYLTMSQLQTLFEALKTAGLDADNIKISKQAGKVVIEKATK